MIVIFYILLLWIIVTIIGGEYPISIHPITSPESPSPSGPARLPRAGASAGGGAGARPAADAAAATRHRGVGTGATQGGDAAGGELTS